MIIRVGKGERGVRGEEIEGKIGMRKDYNKFEVGRGMVEKDVVKGKRIIKG